MTASRIGGRESISDCDDTERREREGMSRCRLDAVEQRLDTQIDTDTDTHGDKDRSDDGDWRARILGEGRKGGRCLGMYSRMEDE